MRKWLKCLKTLDIAALWEETCFIGSFQIYNLNNQYTVKGADFTKLVQCFEAPQDMPLKSQGIVVCLVPCQR